MGTVNSRRSTRRSLETSAITALAPVVAVAPVWLLSLAVWWLPFHFAFDVPFWLFAAGHLAAGVLLFLRPANGIYLPPQVLRLKGKSTVVPVAAVARTESTAADIPVAAEAAYKKLGTNAARPARTSAPAVPSRWGAGFW